jgi:hypothetical protein
LFPLFFFLRHQNVVIIGFVVKQFSNFVDGEIEADESEFECLADVFDFLVMDFSAFDSVLGESLFGCDLDPCSLLLGVVIGKVDAFGHDFAGVGPVKEILLDICGPSAAPFNDAVGEASVVVFLDMDCVGLRAEFALLYHCRAQGVLEHHLLTVVGRHHLAGHHLVQFIQRLPIGEQSCEVGDLLLQLLDSVIFLVQLLPEYQNLPFCLPFSCSFVFHHLALKQGD